MKSQEIAEISRKVALVYGEKCSSHFVALAEKASVGSDLQELVDKAVEETYTEQFSTGSVTMSALQFNSR
jgi:hypothetical protein